MRPVAITNRKIPFHMRPKIDQEEQRLLREDTIEKVPVGEPTPWVSPIVIPPKKDGSIRLCIDMREPNKAIMRERHNMPTLGELIHDLNGATVFSKLDLSMAITSWSGIRHPGTSQRSGHTTASTGTKD